MRPWALDILRCRTCGARALSVVESGLVCEQCGRTYRTHRDVTDFLDPLHPVVARERAAVLALGRAAPDAPRRLQPLLRELIADRPLAETDLATFPCLAHARESRDQVRALFRSRPLPPGVTVVELGADHGWMSSLLLGDARRVIALDISDHLELAPDAGSPNLCRILSDMNELPVADSTADVVCAVAAAHHSWDLARTFREAARILKPGGRLYLCCEPMPSRIRFLTGREFGAAERALGINETWVPRSRWVALARRAGFDPELVYPDLDQTALEQRLTRRGVPVSLARTLGPALGPLMHTLQVSIHMVATRR